VVVFAAEHFVRPLLIGNSTRLPFLLVLFGILGGAETFGLLGLFIGPALMTHILKEASPAFTGGALVTLRTTLRCKNRSIAHSRGFGAAKAPPFRMHKNVKSHCCYLENSVSTAAQWLSGAHGTTFGTPQYGADDDDLRVHPP